MTDPFRCSRCRRAGRARPPRRRDAAASSSTPRSRASSGSIPQLNAVITPLFEKARATAARSRASRRAVSRRAVPAEGSDRLQRRRSVPHGHAGAARRGFVAPHDTYLVAQAPRRPGFVVIGKTNAPELGTIPSTEPLAYGPTHNPWDPTRSPGGSSGGSAAAVAAGHGRRSRTPTTAAARSAFPASACGLVGLKPSRGRMLVRARPRRRRRRSRGRGLGEPHGARHGGASSTSSTGAMPGDPYIAPPPQRPYREEVGAAPGPAPHRRDDAGAGGRRRWSTPTASPPTEDAAKLLAVARASGRGRASGGARRDRDVPALRHHVRDLDRAASSTPSAT